jgi:type I restriction enzyme S subunit
MSKEQKLIPELRFPEFTNEGEWDENTIGEVFNSFSGGTPNTSEKEYYGGKIPFIRSAEINREKTELFLTEKGLKNSSAKLVNKDDLLVALYGANSGDSAISKISGAINQAILCLQSEYSNAFTYYFLTFKKEWIISKFIQGGQGNLSGDIVKSINVPFPKKNEQQKIAICLSSLDEVIAAHSQKLELLKNHKKGLMQNLFPQEGEKVPKYRFMEFEKDGEWVEKKLGDVADFINGKAYKQEELLSAGKYRVLRVGNFFTNNEWYYSDLELDEDKYCEKDDLLYAWSASFGPQIWKEEKVIYHYHIWKVKNKIGINRQFLYNLLDYETFRMKAKSLNGFALMHITKGAIEAWESMIPKSEKEQQKIASCLSSLDALITAQAEKIAQLQLHKKGLMQGLFAKIND